VKAWGVYQEVDKKYYNQYLYLALAEGILNERKAMMGCLSMASKRCGRSLKYKEFQEVISEVDSLVK